MATTAVVAVGGSTTQRLPAQGEAVFIFYAPIALGIVVLPDDLLTRAGGL